MKNIIVIISFFAYLAGLHYLTLLPPILPILADAVRSDEPGDTWQHPDQSAYYTHRNNRKEILDELQKKFALSDTFGGIFEYRLNYRPEEVGELVRDQLRSYYLEEVVHPLRESIFINVFEPAKSPMVDEEKREQAKMYLKTVYFPVKVTLRPIFSTASSRVLIWTLIFPATLLVFLSLRKAIKTEI